LQLNIVDKPWVDVIKPTYKTLTADQAMLLAESIAIELHEETDPHPDVLARLGADLDMIPLVKILQKRIDALKLPIKFTVPGKMAVLALTDVPGQVMALLVDCLNAYEDKEVGAGHLANLYPWGFYSAVSFNQYVETLIKTRKVKWSELY
jgi:hypothetical protein